MPLVRRVHRYTYADYVGVEVASPTGKHEFIDGEIYAMAGGTETHSRLSAEVLRLLGNALVDGPCQVHTSDLRLYVEAVGMATFPDGAVICGPLEHHAPSPRDTALNPRVLLEVTSDSSEEHDTTTKLEAYRTIPSLRDYVVVSHRERRITVHHRADDDTWLTRVAITGGHIAVVSLDLTLAVDDVYRKTPVG
ncbi:MAG: Uma2 family endonuclease [Myxococcales bacterium]|nr:Uma2 family endonuclease [Myxococcales bacterium]MBK7195073.1 Uma2 family endonuclease [Myxococcales bacterium]MBP6848520.1 Uma2 family endonuclease [Kofleriaceae bacterium]